MACFFEDIAVTYKLIQNATVVGTSSFSYHYLQRRSGISHCYDVQNLIDYWTAHKQRYEDLKDCMSDETVGLLLKFCAYAISRTWVWNIKSRCPMEILKEMSRFTRNNYPTFGFADWPLKLKSVIFLARYPNKVSFFLAYILNLLNRTLKPRYYK